MSQLFQLIYCSAANQSFDRGELQQLLARARIKNRQLGVTGILLYSDGSFFQVLEGPSEAVDEIFATISADQRHARVTVIIREAIPRRTFDDWSMGFVDITAEEADSILGASDFFQQGESFDQLGPGRAKKLLAAFREGRWRARIDAEAPPMPTPGALSTQQEASLAMLKPGEASESMSNRWYTYAYQPIVDIAAGAVFSHEALIRGLGNEPAGQVLGRIDPSELHLFDEQSRMVAIELAASLGLCNHLNLNFLPLSLASSPTAISSIMDTAARCRLPTKQIVLEVLEREIIEDLDGFTRAVDEHRGSGLLFAIDDFGSGHAGLNLLADFQPDFIKLDMGLVRGIDHRGPRQAIVRGILRTCLDLGIDVIAEGVETEAEYQWLNQEGIQLFQGYLFCRPAFEALPTTIPLLR